MYILWLGFFLGVSVCMVVFLSLNLVTIFASRFTQNNSSQFVVLATDSTTFQFLSKIISVEGQQQQLGLCRFSFGVALMSRYGW